MPVYARFLIGLLAALLAGWASHGPMGRGTAFVDRLEARSKAELRAAEVGHVVEVGFPRRPLSRRAVLRGEATEFQREGQGLFPGIDDRIRAVPGVSGLRWEE